MDLVSRGDMGGERPLNSIVMPLFSDAIAMTVDPISIFALLGSIASAVYAGRAVNEARKANEFAQSAKRMEGLLTLMEFLHREEHRSARKTVLSEEWDPSLDPESAWRVCSSFDLAGLLVQHDVVDRGAFFNYWNPVIPLLATKLEKFISEWQYDGTPGTTYWKHFVWLIEMTRQPAKCGSPRGITSRSTRPCA